MIHFGKISQAQFLKEYWQKKPLLIKQALLDFITPLSADELAGLALEDVFESRLVTGSIASKDWCLRTGPFSAQDFANLPKQNWTLLVQGVDRYVDGSYQLIQKFDFIPRWRFDDVMMSYAAKGGSVGPHFDYYDVFLLQGSGKRRWYLSSKDCEINNYLDDVPLRIMGKFNAEQVFEVATGDVLYVPPKTAHHGVSLDEDCTTLSFGYRAYSAKEMHEFIDMPCPQHLLDTYYQDPKWQENQTPALIPESAIQQAQKILTISPQQFAQFVTQLEMTDVQSLQLFEYDNQGENFNPQHDYQLHPACKVAYLQGQSVQVFINGEALMIFNAIKDSALMDFCNRRVVNSTQQLKLAQQLFTLGVIF
jgi:50S ribosomal protein L16 3-hydroxylase